MKNVARIVAIILVTALSIALGVAGAYIVRLEPGPAWTGRVDAADPMDLNHAEAVAFHARWASTVKAEKERVAAEAEAKRKAEEAAKAEADRKAAEEASQTASNTNVGSQPTRVAPAPQNRTQQPAPAPQGDAWLAAFNRYAGSLPGSYVVSDQGSWGATQLDTGQVYIARRTPLNLLYSVMVHESCHVRQGRAFGGYYGAVSALAPYGGIERTADACALNGGASWINYGVDAKARQGATLF